MALKIVHLCDVHSLKGEDIAASFAHTIALDGGTFAIDLCPTCDQERFTPLVAFLEAFGLLTDGVVDPREAVAENLRELYARERFVSTTTPPQRVRVRSSETRQKETPAPVAPPSAPERSQTQQSAPETAEELSARRKLHEHTRTRLPLVRQMLTDSPEGLSLAEIATRLGEDTTPTQAQNVVTLLKESGHAEFIRLKWWAPENVSQQMREELRAMRESVYARDAVPRLCPVDGVSIVGARSWELHCVNMHGVRPAELLGLACPLDGEEFTAPQVLGMHGRKTHGAVHTPQLFEMAAEADDPVGLIADIRARYASEQS